MKPTGPLETEPAKETQPSLAALPRWQIVAERLTREFTFPSFAAAIAFVNRIALLAEEQDHHPDIAIHYRRVRIELYTWDAKAITSRDTALAALIDNAFGACK